MFIMKSKKLSIKNNKINLLKELLLVKDTGYIHSLSLRIDNRCKVTYDPDTITFKQDIADVDVNAQSYSIDDIDLIPEYNSITIVFYSDVSMNTMRNIVEHASKTYNCECKLLGGNRLDFINFK